jgi:ketosteroid isomerase-like protein
MSEENVELIRQAYERFARDMTVPIEQADLVDLVAPDVHVDVTRRVLNPNSYDGYAGMIEGRREIAEVWDSWVLEPERFIEDGDDVVVIEAIRGRGRGSGVEITDRSATRYSIRDGRIARVVVFLDVDEALRGVAEGG